MNSRIQYIVLAVALVSLIASVSIFFVLSNRLSDLESSVAGISEVQRLTTPGVELYLDAVEEGEVMLYTALPAGNLPMIKEAFEARYPGVKLSYYRAGGATVTRKVVEEHEAGQIAHDVINFGSGAGWFEILDKGFLEQYIPPEAEYYSVGTTEDPFSWRHPDGYWTTMRTLAWGIMYNTELVPEDMVPTSYQDLMDPKYKGMVQCGDPDLSGSVYNIVYQLKELYGWEYWEAMLDNELIFYGQTGEGAKRIALGEAAIDMVQLGYRYMEWVDADEPVEWVYPTDGASLIQLPVALTKNAPHPNAAKLLINWFLSEEGQKYLFRAGSIFSPRGDVDPPADTTAARLEEKFGRLDNYPLYSIDWSKFLDGYDAMQTKWNEIFP